MFGPYLSKAEWKETGEKKMQIFFFCTISGDLIEDFYRGFQNTAILNSKLCYSEVIYNPILILPLTCAFS